MFDLKRKYIKRIGLILGLVGILSMSSTSLAMSELDIFTDDTGFEYIPDEKTEGFEPNDMKEHWSEEYVNWAAEKGYISGYEDGSFKPNGFVTREEAAKILSQGDKFSKYALEFEDARDRWSTEYISNMVRRGYINGYPDGTFNPSGRITRAELAKIIRLMMVPDIEENEEFYDIDDSFAKKYIEELGGILEGYGDGSFKPGNNVTRAEIAAVLYRLDEKNGSYIMDLEGSNYEEFGKEILRHYHDDEFQPIKFKTTRFKGVQSHKEARNIIADSISRALEGRYELGLMIESPTLDIVSFDDSSCTINIQTWSTKEERKRANQWVDYISSFTDGMTADEKMEYFHDGIVLRANYTFNNDLKNAAGVRLSSPYAIIDNGDALCKAYAGLYELFAIRNNLPVEMVWGKAYSAFGKYIGYHAWNKDSRYDENNIIDITWDDMNSPEGRNINPIFISREFYHSGDNRHEEMNALYGTEPNTLFKSHDEIEHENKVFQVEDSENNERNIQP